MIGKNLKNCFRGGPILVALCLFVTAASPLFAAQVEVSYSFDRPEVFPVTLGGENFDRVVMPGLSNTMEAGQPCVPVAGANILVPFGEDVASVAIITGERITIGDGYHIEPGAHPVPISKMTGTAEAPVADPAIYGSRQAFPEFRYERVGTQNFRGYRILVVRLNPVEYIPATGELAYYEKLQVVVNTVPAADQATLFRGLPEDENELITRVDNPEPAVSYLSAAKLGAKNYRLLIITSSALASSFQTLKDYHDTTGFLTEIHTTTDIGSSDPSDVRDYIRDRYLNDGIEYVLIAADDDIIPARDLYVKSWEGSGAEIEYNMPADIFFGCLDGTYNYDGDSYWGEPTDGDGGGDVDLMAEVYIGRASVGSATEADRFVSKTIQYMTTQSDYLRDVLMCGEYLGFGGVSDYAGDMMDQMIDGSSADGYTTVGIPSGQFTIDQLYDRDWAGNDWPQSELINRINAGLHIINHLGHGSEDYAMKLYNSTVSSLTNTDLCFVYTQACLPGHFDGMDCFAEYMNIKSDNGMFAGIMNARYGWGSNYSTDGPSQRFDREFWDAVFSESENKREIGRANHDSKEDNVYRINESCMRWCAYEANLFGDPTVAIRAQGSLAFDFPNGTPDMLPPMTETTIEVNVSGVYDGVPVPGTGVINISVNGRAFSPHQMTEISPNQYEATLPGESCYNTVEYFFGAEEESSGMFYFPSGDPFRALVATDKISIFADDGEADLGWAVSGDAADGMWNRGTPAGLGERGDPPTDFDGSGQCYLTDNVYGNSDVDDGTTYLDSPAFDLSSADDATIHYARWYSNDYGADPHNDVMKVYISDNGGSAWTLVETIGPSEQAAGGWYEHSFDVTEFVTPTATMKLRFEASDLNDGSVIEAAVDDVYVTVYECTSYMCGDATQDDLVNLLDITFLINFKYKDGPPPAVMQAGDVNSDTSVDLLDIIYLIRYKYKGGPDPACL